MPKRWDNNQLNVIADFFFDSHQDFGGNGNPPTIWRMGSY
jgi:hypothetical protein